MLRLSPQMWDDISRWAADEFRSVNGQIEYALREALVRHGRMKREPDAGGNGGGGEA